MMLFNVELSSTRSRPLAVMHPITAVARSSPKSRVGGPVSEVTTASLDRAITFAPGGGTHDAGCAGNGCQSTARPLTRPTGRALPPADEITSIRCRPSTNAIDRPSGENAGAVPRTTRRDAPPDTRRTVIHPRRTNATREPSPDQDGELPQPDRPQLTRPADPHPSAGRDRERSPHRPDRVRDAVELKTLRLDHRRSGESRRSRPRTPSLRRRT